MNGLVTRPIAGVDWTIDTGFVAKAEHENSALSWFIEELVRHFRVMPEIPAKKPVVSVHEQDAGRKPTHRTPDQQLALFAAHDEATENGHLRKLYPHRKQVLDE